MDPLLYPALDETQLPAQDSLAAAELLAIQQGVQVEPRRIDAGYLPPGEESTATVEDARTRSGTSGMIKLLEKQRAEERARKKTQKQQPCTECGSLRFTTVSSVEGSRGLRCALCMHTVSQGNFHVPFAILPETPFDIRALRQQPPIGPYYRLDSQGVVGTSSPLGEMARLMRLPRHRRQ